MELQISDAGANNIGDMPEKGINGPPNSVGVVERVGPNPKPDRAAFPRARRNLGLLGSWPSKVSSLPPMGRSTSHDSFQSASAVYRPRESRVLIRGSDRARASRDELVARYDLATPEECDVIAVLGGDGLMLRVMHRYLHLGRPIFGMNRGTIGFLMNAYRADALSERIQSAKTVTLQPLLMAAKTSDGCVEESLAFNEVSVLRPTRQTANVWISVDGIVRVPLLVAGGVIVTMPTGSAAYNLSANGPLVPLGTNLLTLTPSANFNEFPGVVSVKMSEHRASIVQLFLYADSSLADRITEEQFAC